MYNLYKYVQKIELYYYNRREIEFNKLPNFISNYISRFSLVELLLYFTKFIIKFKIQIKYI